MILAFPLETNSTGNAAYPATLTTLVLMVGRVRRTRHPGAPRAGLAGGRLGAASLPLRTAPEHFGSNLHLLLIGMTRSDTSQDPCVDTCRDDVRLHALPPDG